MRVLFTTRPVTGHYYPMRPLMKALAAAGDDVAVASGEPIVSKARQDGFAAFPVGMDNDDPAVRHQRELMRSLPPSDLRAFAFSEWFVKTEMPPRADALESAVDRFRPHLIVHETAEFAAPLVATSRGIPYATHGFGPLLRADTASLAGEAAAPFWQQRGLHPHPLAGLYQHLYLDICPASLQTPEIADIPHVQPLGPAPPSSSAASLPWLDELAGRLTVYVTLGTVFNEDPSIFMTILEGLQRDDLQVIVTVGPDNDPSALGRQPSNVHVHRFIEQDLVLPRCAAAVVHGGAGSTLGALSHAVPLVVVPQGADQFYNAERVVAAGAGISLMPGQFTSASVGAAVGKILAEPAYRSSARRIQDEFAGMPEPATVRPTLERLAEESSR